jgi:hypothetical protein
MKDRSVYMIAIYLLTMLILAVGGVLYTNAVAQQNNHKWCDMLNTLHSAYAGQPPPPSPIGVRYKANLEALRDRFGC